MKSRIFLFVFVLSCVCGFTQTVDTTKSAQKQGKIICGLPPTPSFPGGSAAFNKFIKDNIRYPDSAKAQGIEGIVYIQYTIDSLGRLSDFVEMRGVLGYPEFSAEAIRVLKLSPNWNTKGVDNLPFRYTQPFRFKLSEESSIVLSDSANMKCGIQIPESELGRVHTFAEVMPRFPGDSMMKYLVHTLKYPAHVDRSLCDHPVYVQFVVDTSGRVVNVELKKPFPVECQKWTDEVLNAFCKMPAWQPGTSNGEPVNIKMVMPLRIRLE